MSMLCTLGSRTGSVGVRLLDCVQVTGGRNGYGAKLANIFSTEFTIETCDGKSQYKQVRVHLYCLSVLVLQTQSPASLQLRQELSLIPCALTAHSWLCIILCIKYVSDVWQQSSTCQVPKT